MSGSSGGTTTSTTNSTTNSTPYNAKYLDTIDTKATDYLDQYPLTYYPYTTYAEPSTGTKDSLTGATNDYLSAGQQTGSKIGTYQNTALAANDSLASGNAYSYASGPNLQIDNLGVTNPASPAITDLTGTATGQTSGAYQTGTASLSDTASGKFLGKNPYLDDVYNAAAEPLKNTYQTTTEPSTTSDYEAAGRYNSGSSANAKGINEEKYGKSLADLSADIYGTDYEKERGRMVTAGNDLGTLGNTATSNATTAANDIGNLEVSGQNSQIDALNSFIKNYYGGETIQQNAINETPTLTKMPSTDYTTSYNAGKETQKLDQNVLNDSQYRYYGDEYSPWATLKEGSSIVGGATPGTTTTTGSKSDPYYSNTAGSLLGGIGGGISAANGLNTLTSGTGLLSAASLGK